MTHPDQSVLWLKFLLRRLIVVDQCKSSAPSTTKLSPETKRDDASFVCLVQSS